MVTSSVKKKTILLAMVFSMLVSLFLPSLSSASTSLTEESKQALIKKATPYVYLDAETEKFTVKKEAADALTEKELKEVKEIVKLNNAEVQKHRSDLQIEGDKFVPKAESGVIEGSAIDKKKNFDWDFTWWGLQVYWSHKFVEKLKDNLALYGGGVAALNATIAYFASPPGWVTSFVAAVAGIGVWAFIQQDKGCGVYLDCYLYVPTRWYSAC
ncbi:hypothetical protein CUC15_04680 [Oceanobacillus zhaokaii]|uniref:Uncharacterized protein n=2 Tax=Oceanobacillus zhaokaii TaxID=2052660 RepID=A0A345PE42_9BACI|nr:hypothetical protein CUC15_04680 [Oceanobacillus zhaokaii]